MKWKHVLYFDKYLLDIILNYTKSHFLLYYMLLYVITLC